MSLQSYRHILALPGVPVLLLVMFFARIPMTAMGITLTLHVVAGLDRGYGAAGLAGMMIMAGTAAAAPMVGRMIDRYGLRPVVAVCAVASTAYWISAPHLPYQLLLVIALPAGALVVPASSIAKQVLAARVPVAGRRTAYSLDSISVELAFMLGPAAGIILATQLSSTVALTFVGGCYGLVGVALYRMNPAIRSAEDTTLHAAVRPPMRTWFTAHLGRALLLAVGALFVLSGTELAVLAALRESGELIWTPLVIAVMCLASLLGGIVHGAAHRSLSQLTLMVLLAALVVPVGLADQHWWLLALAVIPTNLVCAPTLAATTESVINLAPARVRGEVIGLQDAGTRFGLALGSPVVGFVIDRSSAGWGFVAAGVGGLLVAAAAFALGRRSVRSTTVPDYATA
ncbi:MAG: MFS transporter [Haloechinothrix sp.]